MYLITVVIVSGKDESDDFLHQDVDICLLRV